MKRRQKKVQEFQEALKVGDKIVTTSGIYGQITSLNDKSVQVQIADKVRIEVARAAVGGYQGQDPVVPESGNARHHEQEPSLETPHHSSPSSSSSSASASIRSWRSGTTCRSPAG